MTPENQISSNELPIFLNDLRPRLVGDVWIYEPDGKEVLILNGERLRATLEGAKEISPKTSLWDRVVFGWSLKIEEKEGKKVVLASYGTGGNAPDLFKNVFVINQGLGRVVPLSLPGPEVLSLLELTNDNPVFVPVLRRKGKERGVLVTSARALKIPQNQGRIRGFLTA